MGDNTFNWSQEVSVNKWTYMKVTRNHTFTAGEAANANLLVACTGAIIASELQYISELKYKTSKPWWYSRTP